MMQRMKYRKVRVGRVGSSSKLTIRLTLMGMSLIAGSSSPNDDALSSPEVELPGTAFSSPSSIAACFESFGFGSTSTASPSKSGMGVIGSLVAGSCLLCERNRLTSFDAISCAGGGGLRRGAAGSPSQGTCQCILVCRPWTAHNSPTRFSSSYGSISSQKHAINVGDEKVVETPLADKVNWLRRSLDISQRILIA